MNPKQVWLKLCPPPHPPGLLLAPKFCTTPLPPTQFSCLPKEATCLRHFHHPHSLSEMMTPAVYLGSAFLYSLMPLSPDVTETKQVKDLEGPMNPIF